jgi:4-carboxymuconolactone decarboxylase
MKDLTEKGLQTFAEIRGPERSEKMRSEIDGNGFSSALSTLSADFVFGSVWTRDGLDRKQRSLVTMGVLIAQRAANEFKNHVRVGLNNGLTIREIEEAILQSSAYAGFPAARTASRAAIEVMEEMGIPYPGTES